LSSSGLLRLLGGKPAAQPSVSEDEIRVMMQQGAAEGVFAKTEEAMVGNVFRLDELRVTAIMTPRLDIHYLDVEHSRERNQAALTQGRYQSLPVCRGGLDGVLGLLDTKDYLARMLRSEDPRLEDAMHPAVFVPETISTIQLLETLRARRTHVALVLDEYGSVEGMVTLTDLLEAIIGDLPGAAPDDSGDAVRREDGSWLFDGLVGLDRVSKLLGLGQSIDSEDHDYHTLSGLVMDHLGRVPVSGDRFDLKDLRFEVMDMDGNRVDKVLVTRIVEPLP
jgi:putative hemolysin